MKLTHSALIAATLLGTLCARSQPSNDDFVNGWTVSGEAVRTNGTNLGATKEAAEPDHAGNPGGLSVWFNWTAATNMQVQVDTFGSSFDTLLGVYTGPSVNLLSFVAANDDASGSSASLVKFDAVQGSTYHIVIDSYGGSSPGNYVLTIRRLASVMIASPTNGTVLRADLPVRIEIAGEVPSPPITRVDFYQKPSLSSAAASLVASALEPPFCSMLSNAPLGSNGFYIVARDSGGINWTSAVVNVAVVKEGVTILSPADGNTYFGGNPGQVLANAIPVFVYTSLSRGSITNVEFLVDGQEFAHDDTLPFRQSWTNLTGGLHRLIAIGRADTGEAYRSQAVNIGINELLIARGSVWKYLDNGSNQGTNWIAPSFDDSSWASGPAELGYGDGDEATVVNGGPSNNHFITTYFRRPFTLSNATNYVLLVMGVKVDDGVVVYLNGIEAARFNIRTGPISYTTLAFEASDDGSLFHAAFPVPSLLRDGTNLAAVEIHQTGATSSDISFDLDFAGVPRVLANQQPSVAFVTPTNDAVFIAPSAVSLEINARDADGSVSSVDFFSDDVRIGELTNAPYTLNWMSPPLGRHVVKVVAVDDQGALFVAAILVTIYDEMHHPYAKVSAPSDGAVVEGPTNILVNAYATALDGGITNVLFFANGNLIGTDNSSPYSVAWNAPFGSNGLQVIGFGANGLRGTSAVSSIVITIPPTNYVAPFIAGQSPPAFANITNVFTSMTVRFSERVQNVDARDLLVNGMPAAAVTGSGSNYVFSFVQPSFGEVNISWAPNHGITDFGWPSVLSFDEFGPYARWDYELIDRLAPTILARTPTPGTTVTNLTTVSITFSETVTGVDAHDLLVNGTSAFGISGAGSNYTFNVAQPPPGPVTIAWASNHGITDQARFPNGFNAATAGWSLTLDPRVLLVQSNGSWQFLKGTNEASTPIERWRQLDYDGAGWPAGPAPFFYGDPYTNAVIQGTYLDDMRSNYTCIFLRTQFNVPTRNAIESMRINAQFDDGFIAWVNGFEVLRVNMPPSGEIPYTGIATTSSAEPNGTGAAYVLYTLTNAPAYLLNGSNLLAVQVFNTSIGGSDFGWNAQLYAFTSDVEFRAPFLLRESPIQGDVFALTNLTITFSEGVNGVDARDLLVNGTPAASVISSNRAIYTFGFTQPAFGPVVISWATNTGIFDLDELPKPFDGSGGSSTLRYTLLNPSAPTIVSQIPTGGMTVTGLTSITVTFSETVAGVDPADLLLNARPATNVTTTNNTRYTFTFPQPSFGAISVEWATNTGIHDVESPANDFDPERPSAQWSYLLINPVPDVALTSPANNTAVLWPTDVILQATASDNDGSVVLVEFFEATNKLGEQATSPYTITWSNASIGDYIFRAVATDDSGLRGTSSPVRISVVTNLPIRLVRGPYLQMGTPRSAVVRWRTDLDSDTVVLCGLDAENLTNVVIDTIPTNEHVIQIRDLRAQTKYYYSIGSSSQRLAGGADYSFLTSPLPGTPKPTRFWVLGDSGTANEDAQRVRDAYYNFVVTNGPADFWLMLGDNAYNSGLDLEYQSAVFDMYPDTLRNLFLWPTIGNHETAQAFTAADFPYLHIFTLPQNGEAGGVPSGSPRYYAFDYGTIHFVCLDSMSSGRTTNTAMVQWLMSDLAASIADWNIVFFHHPPYTKGNHNSDAETELIEIRQNILPILESQGVDLVLCGHSHDWERSYLLNGHYGSSASLTSAMKIDGGDGREDGSGAYRKDPLGRGVVYTVAGNGGHVTGGPLNHPAHFLSLNELGSMIIDITSNRIDVKLLSDTGSFRDHFTLLKRPAPTAPINLVASAISAMQIDLAWSDIATNETSFSLERSIDRTNFVRVLAVAANATNVTDSGLLANTTYYYRLRAVNGGSESNPSNIASATTPAVGPTPRAPSNLVAFADDGVQFYRSKILLHWRDESANEAGFIIERSSDNSQFSLIASVEQDIDHFVDQGLASATAYYYRVRSFQGSSISAPSNVAGEQTHPQSDVALTGSTVTFHAGSEGQQPMRYEWRFNGTTITEGTNETLIVRSIVPSNEGNYSVVITDANGELVSNPAYLFVIASPVVVSDPVSRTNLVGTTATFAVDVIGQEPFSYQWHHDGETIVGASAATLIIANVQHRDAGYYNVEIQNEFGIAVSDPALLVVQALRLGSIEAFAPDGISLRFIAPANQSCTLLFTPRLGNSWTVLTNYAAAVTERMVQIDLMRTNQGGFYRLRSP